MKKGTKKLHKGTINKIMDWAKQYGKHFCIHDLMEFYNDIPMQNLSGSVSRLVKEKRLIQAFSRESCKMQSKRHLFWIYNDKQDKKPDETPAIPALKAKPKQRTHHKWTEEDVNRLGELLNEGKTRKQIARELGVTFASIGRAIQRFGIKKIKKHRKQRETPQKKGIEAKEISTCPLCGQNCNLLIIKK